MKTRHAIGWAVLITAGLFTQGEAARGQVSGSAATAGGPYTLEQCIQIAMQNNPQIEIARKQVEVQQAALFSSYTGVMPRVNANIIGANRTTSGDRPVIVEGVVLREAPGTTRTDYRNNVFLNMDLYNGGRNWNTIRQARQESESEEFAQTNTENQVIVNVKTGYYSLLRALRLKEVTEESVRLNEEQLRRTQSMYEIGSVARVEVLQTTAQLGAARIDLRNQENAVLQARAELANVMGIGSKETFEIVDPLEGGSLDTTALMSLQDALRMADLTNPAIQRDEGGIRSAMLGTKVARGLLWPTVSGSIGYSRSGIRFQDVYGTYDKNWNLSFGVNLSLPILNGTQTYADISRAQAQQLIAEETLRQTRRTTSLTIRNALLDLETAREVITLSNDNIVASEESLRLAEERYRVGSGTLLEVFTAQEALVRAKSNLAGAQYDYLIAQATLDGALGK
ncbi:MAG: TolC family protein [Gemmatimonadetes bacterium]|nr:TolC family protein [Gemmatimonadota bacterium]MYD26382.1 TolC family protein [Gemmatimonadota bacterium]MYI99538.1 TolC family protein [Gemmatimonadota bacterium]